MAKKTHFVGSKRDMEHLLLMHGEKRGVRVRVNSLHGIQSARLMQRALRRQMSEKNWTVEGLHHLDALVELHSMLATSASLLDEVLWRVEDSRYHDHGHDYGAAAFEFQHPAATVGQESDQLNPGDSASGCHAERSTDALPDDRRESASTHHDSARDKFLVLGDNSASGCDAERNTDVLPDDRRESASTHVDSAYGNFLVVGDNSTSAYQSAAERNGAVLPASTRDDSANGKFLAVSNPAVRAASNSTRRSAHGEYLVLLGDNPSIGSDSKDRNSLGGANDRERSTFPCDDGDSSSALLGANDTLPANSDTGGVEGGGARGDHEEDSIHGDGSAGSVSVGEASVGAIVDQALLAPAAVQTPEYCCYNLDLATHRLYVSGMALRGHRIGSPGIQIVVHGIGREIEEVASALQAARQPPGALLEELQRVKLLLHEVWRLRVPNSDFKVL